MALTDLLKNVSKRDNLLKKINASPKYKTYNKSYDKFKKSFESFIKKLVDKLNKLTTKTKLFYSDTGKLTLEDNTIFKYSGSIGVTNLTIVYPEGDFNSTILFSTRKSGSVKITFPKDSLLVGRRKLEFFPQENWEINIHNGRIAAVQIFDD